MTLYTYKRVFPAKGGEQVYGSVWVFDDPTTGLKAEAFVLGISEMIDRIIDAKEILHAEEGFALTFGFAPFEGADVKLLWLQEGSVTFKPAEEGKEEVTVLIGNWYGGKVAGKTMVGWLCPALLKYFPEPPKTLYVGAAPLPEGVDPIWHDAPVKAYVKAGDESDDEVWIEYPEGYDLQN